MLTATIRGLRVLNALNWLVAALFAGLLALMLLAPDVFRDAFDGELGPGGADAWRWLTAMLALTPPVALAAHLILTRLVAMLRDAAQGAALSRRNAARLRHIAWALLAINVADLVFGRFSVEASAATGEYFGWSLSLTGWLAVPLLLVLARVFEEGARMRDDLEGTV